MRPSLYSYNPFILLVQPLRVLTSMVEINCSFKQFPAIDY